MKIIYFILLLLFIGCGGNTKKSTNSEIKTLDSIEFSISSDKIPTGYTKQLPLQGTYYIDGKKTKEAITNQITYHSSDDTIATVTPDGKLTTLKPGKVTITASYQNKTATITLVIQEAILKKIKIFPLTQAKLSQLAQHESFLNQELIRAKVLAYYEGNNTQDITDKVKWYSSSDGLNISDDGYLTVSNSKDFNASISVEFEGFEDTTTFEIKKYNVINYKIQEYSQESSSSKFKFHKGTRIRFAKTPSAYLIATNNYEIKKTIGLLGIYADGSQAILKPSWYINDEKISLTSGYFCKDEGTYTLSAKLEDVSIDTNLTVTEPIIRRLEFVSNLRATIVNESIEIKLADIHLILSDGTQKELTQDELSFKNLSPTLINLEKNTIKTLKEGKASIEVSYKEDSNTYKDIIDQYIGKISSIENINEIFALYVGDKRTLGVSGDIDVPDENQMGAKFMKRYTDISKYVRWESLTPKIATITQDGEITGLSEGVAQLKVTYQGDEYNITKVFTQTVDKH